MENDELEGPTRNGLEAWGGVNEEQRAVGKPCGDFQQVRDLTDSTSLGP